MAFYAENGHSDMLPTDELPPMTAMSACDLRIRRSNMDVQTSVAVHHQHNSMEPSADDVPGITSSSACSHYRDDVEYNDIEDEENDDKDSTTIDGNTYRTSSTIMTSPAYKQIRSDIVIGFRYKGTL